MRLFEDDPQGYTKRLDTAFSVQNIVEELHYQHSARGCAHSARRHVRARAEPFVEQRDEGGSYDYYLKRGGGGGAEGGAMALRSETAPLACGSWRACV